jgi:hypothetical protein
MSGVETENEPGTIIEMSVETSLGTYVYVFSDEVPVEDLGIIVHDLAQILLSEGEVVVHADFLFQKKVGGSELGPEWE